MAEVDAGRLEGVQLLQRRESREMYNRLREIEVYSRYSEERLKKTVLNPSPCRLFCNTPRVDKSVYFSHLSFHLLPLRFLVNFI